MGGGKGGGGGGQISVPENPYEAQMANMASQLWTQTSPVRGYFTEDWQKFFRPETAAPILKPGATPISQTPVYRPSTGTPSGDWSYNQISADPSVNFWSNQAGERRYLPASDYPGAGAGSGGQTIEGYNPVYSPDSYLPARRYDPNNIPGYQPLYSMARTGMEDQFNTARQNILAGMPRGGGMERALANLETGRAADIGSLQSSISSNLLQDIFNKAYGAAWSSPQTSLGGLGGAAQSWTSRANAEAMMAAQEAAAQRNAGTMKGAGVGSILGKGASAGLSAATGGMSSLGKGAAAPAYSLGTGGYGRFFG